MYNHNANFTHCCQVCPLEKIFLKTYQQCLMDSSLLFLTIVHERRSKTTDITSPFDIKKGKVCSAYFTWWSLNNTIKLIEIKKRGNNSLNLMENHTTQTKADEDRWGCQCCVDV